MLRPGKCSGAWARRHRRRAPSGRQALRMVYGLVQQQELALSNLDVIRLFALAMVAVILLVLLMRRSLVSKGAAVAH
jgi:hypothetical protein